MAAETANIVAVCDWCRAAGHPGPAAQILDTLLVEVLFASTDRLWTVAEELVDLLPPGDARLPALCSIAVWARVQHAELAEAQSWIDRGEALRAAHPSGPWHLLDWGRWCLLAVTARLDEGREVLARVVEGAEAYGQLQLAIIADATSVYALLPELRHHAEAEVVARRELTHAESAGAGLARAWARSTFARALAQTDPGEAVRQAEMG